jgi:NAD(P)-dependent dehydrogenase (short-subunit alcohol dehydrogenase family)
MMVAVRVAGDRTWEIREDSKIIGAGGGCGMDVAGNTIIVTGATGNLGGAVAGAFLDRGANVVLVARSVEGLARRFGQEDARRSFVAADLTRQDDAAAIVAQALARFGRIDTLCNLAGGFRMGVPVHETTDAMFDALYAVNVRSAVNMVRVVVPVMLAAGQGSIVNVAALAAQKGVGNMGAYCASKAVVVRLAESMAAELGARNIRVNCVLPSTLDTPQNRAAMPDADPGAWVAPADLAQAIVFLASPAAITINGAAIPVTGRA